MLLTPFLFFYSVKITNELTNPGTASSLNPMCCVLLLKQAALDVLQHGQQLLLHVGFWNRGLCARVSPHGDTLTLLHVFGTHFQTDGNTLDKRPERETNTVK